VVMFDRRKLAAPLFAQATAFVAVLIIGGFTGHAATTTTPGPVSSTGTPSATASSPAAKGPAVKLTVKAVPQGDGLVVSGSPVRVLQNGTLASVASGTLNQSLEYAANVPAGQYQVCIEPPIGWDSAVPTTHVLAGWICSGADLRSGPQLVTFRLTPQVPQVSP
jgi:hypothetical protein